MINYKNWADPATLSHKEIQELITQTREETIRKIEAELTVKKKKTGFVNIIFGDCRKDEIPVESNYDYGFNTCLEEVKQSLNKLKK